MEVCVRVVVPTPLLAAFVPRSGCGASGPPDDAGPTESPADGGNDHAPDTRTMYVTSNAYEENAPIPSKYTCDGDDTTPPWSLHEVPPDAVSLAAIFDDPDAPRGTWVHWIAWDLEPEDTQWAEGTDGAGLGTVGTNSWGNRFYGGPCPPSGTHRYILTVYALDARLGLAPGSDRDALDKAMVGHILEQAQLQGTYNRE